MNSIFDINRFSMVLRREAVINSRIYLGTTAFIFGAYFMAYFIATLIGGMIPHGVETRLYYFFLILGGAIFTSQAFSDIKRPIGYFYMMLPASLLEKVFSKWLITLMGWFFAYTLSFNLVAMFGHGIFIMAHGGTFTYQFIVPFIGDNLNNLISLLFFHAIFLLGAAIFRRKAFLYTFLSLTGFIILLTVIIMVVTIFTRIDMQVYITQLISMSKIKNIGTIFTLVLTVLFWFLTFLRIRKTVL